jgi:CelD/BcsL family acetyltransferase involved in cellulose biosynthesis
MLLDPAELSSFREQWDAIALGIGWPMAESGWVMPAIRCLEPRADVRVLLALKAGKLRAGVALSGERATPGAVYRPAGSAALAEANVLLAADAEAAGALLGQLAGLGIPFALPRMLYGERLEAALTSACAGRGKLIETGSSGAPSLDISKGIDAVLGGLSANWRSGLRRKERKLARLGQVGFTATTPSGDEVDRELEAFAALEDAGWKGRGGSSIRRRTGFESFFRSALRHFAGERRVRFDHLTLDGKDLAIQFGLVSHGRYMLIKPTYDEHLSDLSPGYLLTLAAIRHSIDTGLTAYEFLGADDPWKLHWTKVLRPTRTWVFYPFNLRGATAVAHDLVATMAKRFRR